MVAWERGREGGREGGREESEEREGVGGTEKNHL